jgi:hypothetical protein
MEIQTNLRQSHLDTQGGIVNKLALNSGTKDSLTWLT